MYFINQTGMKVLMDNQLVLGKWEYDEDTEMWNVIWLTGSDDDQDGFTQELMAQYYDLADVKLMSRLRNWAECESNLSEFKYPSADEAVELREQIETLLTERLT